MRFPEKKLRSVYLAQMAEASKRLFVAEKCIESFSQKDDPVDFDSGVLQLRKSLEAVAYAAIAPNKPQYQAFRANAEDHGDFARDFKASAIFANLARVNKDFYPTPLLPAERQQDGSWHFERKKDGFLTKKRFERVYNRLGKFMHADNPWSPNKHSHNLAGEIPRIAKELRSLIELHVAFIRAPDYVGAWVVRVPQDGTPPDIISAKATGRFVVGSS